MLSQKTIIVTNGNAPQVSFLPLLNKTLRDKRRGNFSGPFIFLTDHIPEKSINLLSNQGITVQVLAADKIEMWSNMVPSNKHPFGKRGKPFFIRDAAQMYANTYENLIYLDPDILIQGSIQRIVDMVENDRILMSSEAKLMLDNKWALKQLARAVDNGDVEHTIFSVFAPEVNTGFMAGKINTIVDFTSEFINFMVSEQFRPYAWSEPGAAAWHDQDYFRCFIRIKKEYRPILLGEEFVVHLCANGHMKVINQPFTINFRLKESLKKPNVVHFAGGTWRRYGMISYKYGRTSIWWKRHLTLFLRPHRKNLNLLKRRLWRTYRVVKRWLMRGSYWLQSQVKQFF
jgi:hypothetical protein